MVSLFVMVFSSTIHAPLSSSIPSVNFSQQMSWSVCSTTWLTVSVIWPSTNNRYSVRVNSSKQFPVSSMKKRKSSLRATIENLPQSVSPCSKMLSYADIVMQSHPCKGFFTGVLGWAVWQSTRHCLSEKQVQASSTKRNPCSQSAWEKARSMARSVVDVAVSSSPVFGRQSGPSPWSKKESNSYCSTHPSR